MFSVHILCDSIGRKFKMKVSQFGRMWDRKYLWVDSNDLRIINVLLDFRIVLHMV